MRQFPLNYRSAWSTAARLAGLCLLSVLLLVPASIFASATQATFNREHRTRRLHSGRQAHHRHPAAHLQTRNSRSRHQYARVRRASMHRHLSRRARARRYRLEATLDNIRTHTPPTETPTETGEDSATRMELTRTPALMSPPVTPARTAATVTRDLPFFNASVPQYMPIALRGSHEVLVHQNIIADVEGLSRIQNDSQLREMVHSGDLVALPASAALVVDPRLPLNRRYCRPWTEKFLADLSRAHESVFGHALQLTSAVRTVDFQRHLAHYNGNAAPAYGETASPHLTGQAIDLGKKGMSLHEIAWMRAVLGQLQTAGKLDVEEEFEQACFHISVYKTYAPHPTLPATLVATNVVPATDESQPQEAPAATPIGGLTPTAVSEPVIRRTTWSRRHSYYSAHPVRRAAVRHRRRRHHASMALIAARMR